MEMIWKITWDHALRRVVVEILSFALEAIETVCVLQV